MGRITDAKDTDTKFGGADMFFNPAFEQGENVYRLLEIGKYYKGGHRPDPDSQWEKGTIFTADNTQEGRKELEELGVNDMRGIWACIAYSYNKGTVGVLEITQKTIIGAIATLWKNPKWGDPSGYDVSITRTGTGFETEYTVVPNPKEELAKEIAEARNNFEFDLDTFYIEQKGVLGGTQDTEDEGTFDNNDGFDEAPDSVIKKGVKAKDDSNESDNFKGLKDENGNVTF